MLTAAVDKSVDDHTEESFSSLPRMIERSARGELAGLYSEEE
jgi:hypothetical protein